MYYQSIGTNYDSYLHMRIDAVCPQAAQYCDTLVEESISGKKF